VTAPDARTSSYRSRIVLVMTAEVSKTFIHGTLKRIDASMEYRSHTFVTTYGYLFSSTFAS